MKYVDQEVVFQTEPAYGGDVPLSLSAPILRRLAGATRPSVRMIMEGTSTLAGSTPAWLERASDVRTLGFSEKDGLSVLHLKAPTLGEAAPRLFEQQLLWPGAASPNDTAIQVIGRIASAVREGESGSDLFDRSLLKNFSSWSRLFRGGLKSVGFCAPSKVSGSARVGRGPLIDELLTANARALSEQTPSPRQVRVVGRLDMVRHSTRSFGLLLDDGEEVRGVLVDGTSELLQSYFGKEITVLGKAIYRPSGSLLRIDALEILPLTQGRGAFSKVPASLQQAAKPQHGPRLVKGCAGAFFGCWPGEETDGELLEALAGIRD